MASGEVPVRARLRASFGRRRPYDRPQAAVGGVPGDDLDQLPGRLPPRAACRPRLPEREEQDVRRTADVRPPPGALSLHPPPEQDDPHYRLPAPQRAPRDVPGDGPDRNCR